MTLEKNHTPRTDAEVIMKPNGSHRELAEFVKADFARQLERELLVKQAQIDRLMLEYCPYEMTPAQIGEWGLNQKSVGPEEAAKLDATLPRKAV